MYFDSFCAGYNINSTGSKRSLGTNTSKKAIFLVTESSGLFLGIVESDKPQGTIYKGSKCF